MVGAEQFLILLNILLDEEEFTSWILLFLQPIQFILNLLQQSRNLDSIFQLLNSLYSGRGLYQHNKDDFLFMFWLLIHFFRFTILQVVKEKVFKFRLLFVSMFKCIHAV